MNGYLLPIPVVALTMTLAACSDGVMEHPPAGSPYSVEFTLWTGPPAYYTSPQGEPELFTFSAVTVGIPCEFDSGSSPYQGTPVTLGACTYDPPLSPIADPPRNCGTPNTAANAGTITVSDSTTMSTVATYNWTSQGYPIDPGGIVSTSFANPVWQVGDAVSVTASGADVPAFSLATHALSAPAIPLPASFSAHENLAFSWTPDPNAQTMEVTIEDTKQGSFIDCTPEDAAGSLSIDASLFANFSSSDTFTVTISREADVTKSDGPAQVGLRSFSGWDTGSIAFE
jgi:hypothetical protein